jgi:hypothetical protein
MGFLAGIPYSKLRITTIDTELAVTDQYSTAILAESELWGPDVSTVCTVSNRYSTCTV